MIAYRIGQSGQRLVLADSVVAHLHRQRQTRWWQRETGGQLFAQFNPGAVHVVLATGPRPSDRRSPFSYVPDRKAEQLEIEAQHERGLHFVGDWHSHAQEVPRPSRQDIASIRDCVRKSAHALNGFVLLIVGTREPPVGLFVAIHDGIELHVLSTSDSTS